MDLTEVADASHSVADLLEGILDWSKIKMILSYAPINHEIDPTLFESRLKGKYPDIQIDHIIASPNASQPDKEYDVILVPCLAADTKRNRLGYGIGWYDDMLAKQKGKKIGLTYKFGLMYELPVQDHDERLDMVVTPEQVVD